MISNDGNISFVTSHTSKHIHHAQLNLNSILDVQHNNLVNLGAFCSTKRKKRCFKKDPCLKKIKRNINANHNRGIKTVILFSENIFVTVMFG